MDFAALKELVNIITRNRVKNIAVLGNPGQESKRTDRLYNLLRKSEINSDLEAAKAVFGPKATNNHTYKRIKQRLVRQLVNSVFFMDFDKIKYNDRASAYYYCNRDITAANLLLMNHADKSASVILTQSLETSTKYEFIDLKAEASRLLSILNSRNKYIEPEYKYYAKLYAKAEYERYWTRRAAICYEHLIQMHVEPSSSNYRIHKKAKNYYDKLSSKKSKILNSQFECDINLIAIIMFAAIFDYRKTLDHATSALSILENNPNVNRGYIHFVTGYIIRCMIQLQINDHYYCTELFNKCILSSTKGTVNWLMLMYHYILFLLQHKKYDEALLYLKEKANNSLIVSNNQIHNEQWTLLVGYLFLLQLFGKLPKEDLNSLLGPFRMGKFLNSFSILSKEKQERNIPIILLPLLFALAEGKIKYYGPSPEALHKYRQRRLETDSNRRSALFVRLLLAYHEKRNSTENPSSLDRKIDEILATLFALPMKNVPQPPNVEIIPYEHLWEMIIENETRRQQNIT